MRPDNLDGENGSPGSAARAGAWNSTTAPRSRFARMRRAGPIVVGLAVAAGPATLVPRTASAVGTWAKVPPNPGTGAGSQGFWVLTDGSVLSTAENSWSWAILKPDATGSYENGKWTEVAKSSYGRGGAQQYVLKDGRFFIAGGEYLYQWPGCGSNCYAQDSCNDSKFGNVEIYDPVNDKWTVEATAPYVIADTGSAMLADGRILDSANCGNQIQIYDPTKNAWTTSGNELLQGTESSWANLLNGGILAVANSAAAVYDPTAQKWVSTGAYPSGAQFIGCNVCGADTSGVVGMFDGRVLAFTNPNTMLYAPGATASDPGAWASGPAMLNGDVAGDEYADTEPNGKVLVTTNPNGKGPDMIQEYDPATNKFTNTNIPNIGCGCSYMNLPNGQILVTGGDANYLYTPDSQSDDAWRPTVSSVTYDGTGTYTLTGTQLSGLISGGDEGDDQKATATFPIVWLKSTSGVVYYARSFNFSVMVPAKGNTPQTCQFLLPSGMPGGTYDLYVSSVGVQSKSPVMFTVGEGSPNAGDAGASDEGGASGASADASSTSDDSGGSGSSGSSSSGSVDGAASGSTSSGNSGTSSSSGSSNSGGSADGATSGSTSDAGSTGAAASGGVDAGASGGTSKASGCGCVAAGVERGPAGVCGVGLFGALFAARRRRSRRHGLRTAPLGR